MCKDVKEDSLSFLDWAVHTGEDRSLNSDVYRKPTHTDQYLLFDSHHPLKDRLGVITALNHQAETMPTKRDGKETEWKHIKGAFKICGYSNWTHIKTSKRSRADREEERRRRGDAGTSEKLRRSFNIISQFTIEWQRHKLVHPKDKTPRHEHSCVVQDCTDLYIGT